MFAGVVGSGGAGGAALETGVVLGREGARWRVRLDGGAVVTAQSLQAASPSSAPQAGAPREWAAGDRVRLLPLAHPVPGQGGWTILGPAADAGADLVEVVCHG